MEDLLQGEPLDGKYAIGRRLGQGGMGAVYKVRHRLLGEVRVVKVMRSALEGDENVRTRFLAEALARLKESFETMRTLSLHSQLTEDLEDGEPLLDAACSLDERRNLLRAGRIESEPEPNSGVPE